MRRPALVAAVVLAGCGGGDAPHKPKHPPTKRERAAQERVHRQLERSSLPKDMRRELEEAQRLLDESD